MGCFGFFNKSARSGKENKRSLEGDPLWARMWCFGFFNKSAKSGKEKGKERSETLAVSAATTSPSNYETSRSYDSTGKQTSKSSVSSSSQPSISAMFEEKGSVLRVFELAKLRSASNDFSRTLKIGGGGFGSVYKGFVKPLDEKSGRITVAVKSLNQRSLQGISSGWLKFNSLEFLNIQIL